MANFIVAVVNTFIRAFWGMLILGAVIPEGVWHPGYWQALGLCVVIQGWSDNWLSILVLDEL